MGRCNWKRRGQVKKDRQGFDLLKPSSVAIIRTVIQTGLDWEKISSFHATEESRPIGMAGSRRSCDVIKRFSSQLFPSGLPSFSGSLFPYGGNLLAANSSWITLYGNSNHNWKSFAFPVDLAKVLWLNLIESTGSGIHLWTSHCSHGNAIGSAAPKT